MFRLGSLPHVASAPSLPSLRLHSDSESSSENREDGDTHMVDKVYTVGCFDLLHRGHEKLFKNMRTMGREVHYIHCSLLLILPSHYPWWINE